MKVCSTAPGSNLDKEAGWPPTHRFSSVHKRERGSIGNKNEDWPLDIRFLFGENEQDLYLDYHFEDRRSDKAIIEFTKMVRLMPYKR